MAQQGTNWAAASRFKSLMHTMCMLALFFFSILIISGLISSSAFAAETVTAVDVDTLHEIFDEFTPWLQQAKYRRNVSVSRAAKQLIVASATGHYTFNINPTLTPDDYQHRKTMQMHAPGRQLAWRITQQIPLQLLRGKIDEKKRAQLFNALRYTFTGDAALHPFMDSSRFQLSEPQLQAKDAFFRSLKKGEKAGTIVLPTAVGKTVLAASIYNKLKPGRTLYLCHLNGVLEDAEKTLLHYNPQLRVQDVGHFYGQKNPDAGQKALVMGNIASFNAEIVLESFSPDHFDFIIVDESHHASSSSYSRLLEHFKPRYVLGLTATPFRTDEQDPVASIGGEVLFQKSTGSAVIEGYISDVEYHLFEDDTNYLKAIKTDKPTNNEKIKREYFIESRILYAIKKYKELSSGKLTVAFAKDTITAKKIADLFNREGVAAEVYIDESEANEKERRQAILDRFSSGKTKVMVVVDLFNEGRNIPGIETVLFLGYTDSQVQQIQQLGRGMRLFLRKKRLLALDFVGNYRSLSAILNLGRTLSKGRLFDTFGRGGNAGPSIYELEEREIAELDFEHELIISSELKKLILETNEHILLDPVALRKQQALEELSNHQTASQDDIAQLIGVSRSTIMQWLKNDLSFFQQWDEIALSRTSVLKQEALSSLMSSPFSSQEAIAADIGIGRSTVVGWLRDDAQFKQRWKEIVAKELARRKTKIVEALVLNPKMSQKKMSEEADVSLKVLRNWLEEDPAFNQACDKTKANGQEMLRARLTRADLAPRKQTVIDIFEGDPLASKPEIAAKADVSLKMLYYWLNTDPVFKRAWDEHVITPEDQEAALMDAVLEELERSPTAPQWKLADIVGAKEDQIRKWRRSNPDFARSWNMLRELAGQSCARLADDVGNLKTAPVRVK